MRRKHSLKLRRYYWRLWLILLVAPFLWVGQSRVKAKLRTPQAILVLGGAVEREHYAAEFAYHNPELEVWVSSGTNPEYADWLFRQADVAPTRIHLDYQAVDTVTNFTTLVDELKGHRVNSIYLITSDYHMRRATIIGQIVLGRHDIAFRTVSVPSEDPRPEPIARGLRDGARAIWWVITGQTGSSLGQLLTKS